MKQGCHGQGKYLENDIFSRSRKSQGISLMARGIQKGLEKSGNLKINGYGRQSSENSVQEGKGFTFSKDSLSQSTPSLGATLKGKNLLPWGANSFL